MKTLLITLLFVAQSAMALTIVVPKDCDIQGTEFSTGGGKKMIQYVEVDCKIGDRYEKHIVSWASVSGMFGFGRWTMPDKIYFIKEDVAKAYKK